ncbi:MAG: nitroreductase family protein [Sphaerochaetaceae bacterium]|nr:nitroreductase family protein [Sphaerochaetaceae bacterium]
MTFTDLARARFSVRKFDGRPVPKKKLNAILEAGRVAPTAKNNQPQKVYVLQSREALEKINGVCKCIYGASTVLVVCYDSSLIWKNPIDEGVDSGRIDTSIVLTHMMLEAQNQGVNSCWVCFFNAKEVSEALNLPENIVPVSIMPLGFACEDVVPTPLHSQIRPEEETVIRM